MSIKWAEDPGPNYPKATNILRKLPKSDLTFLTDQAGLDLGTKDRLVTGLLIVLRVHRPSSNSFGKRRPCCKK